jgi:hypothetical protein
MRCFPILLITAVVTTACENDPATFAEGIAGTYDLQSIGGATLPIVFQNDSVKREITGAELLMGLNGVYREIDRFRFTRGTTVTTQVDTFTAVWVLESNNRLTMTTETSTGPQTFTATWDGTRTITVDVSGLPWVFRR